MTTTALPPPAPAQLDTCAALEAELRLRDAAPAYADAPVLDVYGRISKNPETGELEKVDRQLADCLANLRGRRARLGKVLRDDGISAWSVKARRPDWAELVRRLEDRLSAGVIVWHTDRLMRQSKDLERLVDLGTRDVLVASCHGDYDLASSDDRFTLRILTAAAQKDSDNTSRRQKRKAESMRASGRRSGGRRAFGEPGKLTNGERATEEQVNEEREAVSWAVTSHLAGVSLHAIAAEWNGRGLLTAAGNEWDARTVAPVLRAPRIAGLLAFNGNIIGKLEGVEPIVDREEFEASVALFASRRRGRPVSAPYLLSGGLLFCAHCDQPLTGKAKSEPDGTTRPKYVCRRRGLGCGRMSIDVTLCDAAVRGIVIDLLSDPRHVRQVVKQTKALAEAQSKLDKAVATATELSRRLGEGMPFERYDAAMAPLDARIARLREEVDALRASGAGGAARAASREEIAVVWDGPEDGPEATVEDRRALVRAAARRGLLVSSAVPARGQQTVDVTARLRIIAGP